jgi:peptidase A4-like protein
MDSASSSKPTYSSIWVGIDGYGSGTVEQIGTEHDWDNGKEEHYAWFEMFPKYPHQLVGFPVEPGDVITGEVSYVGNDTFKLSLSNHTKHVTTTVPTTHTQTPKANRSSAEWIVEAPATSDGVLPLAHLSEVTMTDCTATIDGVSGPISNGQWKSSKLNMASKSGTVKAQASDLTNSGKDFTVQWKHQ